MLLSVLALICLAGGVRIALQAKHSSVAAAAVASPPAAAPDGGPTPWLTTPVTSIFPATIDAAVSGVPWVRVAISSSTSCTAALTAAFQPSDQTPCTAVLRATYLDRAKTIAATVGIIVSPSVQDAAGSDTATTWQDPIENLVLKAFGALNKTGAAPTAIRVLPAAGTVAAHWTDANVIGMSASSDLDGNAANWMALVVETGSLDGRAAKAGQLPGPWGSQLAGDLRDRDQWLIPAEDLDRALCAYYSKLFG